MASILRPALFPFANLLTMTFSNLEPLTNQATPMASFREQVTVVVAGLPKLLIALASWLLLVKYNIVEEARTLQLWWIGHIVVRDLIITLVGAGIWEWLLYADASPYKAKLRARKFNPVYPPADVMRFCIFWSTVSTLVASAIEVWYIHKLATAWAGKWDTDITSWATIVWIATLAHWRIVHFFIVHRAIHPWRLSWLPDVGRFLYRHVHSLHHKSYNPTAFSGISMHPVESFLYYTAALIPVAFHAHPLVFLLTKHDCTLGALWGHDGFAYPGSGSYPHYLHHAHFEVNYGENYVPLDYLFGTFANGPRIVNGGTPDKHD